MAKNKRAFTLVELMLAAGLMTVIFTVVLSIASNVLTTWNRNSGNIKAIGQANMMLKTIQEDFECMVLKKDGGAWLQVAYPTSVGMLRSSSVTASSPLMPPEIMFYSTPIDRPRYTSSEMSQDAYSRTPIAGSLCAMKYRIAIKSPFLSSSGNSGTDANQYNAFYGFYRAVMDAQSTFDNALGETVQGTSTETVTDKLYDFWNQGNATILDEDGDRTSQQLNTWVLSAENLLCTNVVDFKVSFTVKYIDPDSAELYDEYAYATIPAGAPFTMSDKLYLEDNLYTRSQSGSIVYNVSPSDVENASLLYADISLTILTNRGQKEMIALMNRNRMTLEKFREITRAHSVTVVKRISFMGDSI